MDHWLLTHDWLIFKWGLISFMGSIVLAVVVKALKLNCNIFHIPRNIIRFFIYLKRGRRYIARIDGTWRIVKGSVSAGGYLHTDKVFPKNVEYCLSDDEFHKVKVTESDDDVKDKIISLNLHYLKRRFPLPIDNRPRPRHYVRDPFAEERPRRTMYEPFEPFEVALNTLSPEMRAYMERQLGIDALTEDE